MPLAHYPEAKLRKAKFPSAQTHCATLQNFNTTRRRMQKLIGMGEDLNLLIARSRAMFTPF